MAFPPEGPIGFRLAHELEGILRGISADGVIVPAEVDRLTRWLERSAEHRHIEPFKELSAQVDSALADGILTLEECEDLLFVTTKLTTVNPHFSSMRTGVQMLMGILAGVGADLVISESEARSLAAWIDEWGHLKGLWPYDECEAIVTSILGHPDRHEIGYLLSLAQQFPVAGHKAPGNDAPPLLIGGVCAVNPTIDFAGRQFVFTGESDRCARRDMEARVRERDGVPHPRVTEKTDYLVVCNEGNPLWAFACYGRKVERAYNLRREGHPITILHEADYWDALA